MAKQKMTNTKAPFGEVGLVLELSLAKETKGTYVFEMAYGETPVGSIYLQKLLFGGAKPAEQQTMTIVPKTAVPKANVPKA